MPSKDFGEILHVIGDRLAPSEETKKVKRTVKGNGKKPKAEKPLRLVPEQSRDGLRSEQEARP
jgi:hypothetical protein